LSEKKHAIVGIDPGATFGIAIVGLDGKWIALRSTAGGFPDAARIIEAQCTPSLVACDTNPAPEAALRMASYFSCRLFTPRASIREEDKRQVARGAGTANTHERDAYCAAIFAYRASANKLRQIDALSELTIHERDRIKHMLLRGYRVQDAFMLLREPEEKEEAAQKLPVAARAASSGELRDRLEALARENSNLRLSLERLEGEKAALVHRLHLMENGARQTFLRDSEFRKLRFQLQTAMNRLSWRGKKKLQPITPKKEAPKMPVQEKKTAPAKPEHSEGTDSRNSGWRAFAPSGAKPEHSEGTDRHGGGRAFAPSGAKPEHSEGINSLGEQGIDLERLVAEYRKGRKNI
jgi:predicted RNase H-like nuclease (RuvC/YqgF family)